MLSSTNTIRYRLKGLSIILAAGLLTLSATAQTRSYSAVGVDKETGKKIFTARYIEKTVNGNLESIDGTYWSADGKEKVATRKVQFRNNPYAPNFVFQNFRTNSTEVFTADKNKVEVHYKKNSTAPAVKKSITVPGTAVVDAGLVELIKDHWTLLKSGKKDVFNIVSPSRQDYYGFILYDQSTEADKKAGQTRLILVAENWLVKAVVAPIIMVFDNTTKQLLRYEGTTSFTDENGAVYSKAIITYHFDK